MRGIVHLSRWFALAAVTATLCLATLPVGESGLRWWYRDVTPAGDNSSWFAHRWHHQDIGKDQSGLNSLRFRDREWSPEKSDAGVEWLDLQSRFTDFKGDSRTFVPNRFDGHPDDVANAIASEGIAAHFGKRWHEAAGR